MRLCTCFCCCCYVFVVVIAAVIVDSIRVDMFIMMIFVNSLLDFNYVIVVVFVVTIVNVVDCC